MAQVGGVSSGTLPAPTSPALPWKDWPGARIPETSHPAGTIYVGHDRIPQYPGGTTCSMLGEPEPYLPITWELFALIFMALLLYVVWPLYVLRHLIRKSVYGGDDLFQTNHDAYRAKMDAMGKSKDEVSED